MVAVVYFLWMSLRRREKMSGKSPGNSLGEVGDLKSPRELLKGIGRDGGEHLREREDMSCLMREDREKR